MAQAFTYKGTRARRRSTRGDGVGDGPPREACRKRDDRGSIVADGSRFFGPRRARARVDVLCYGSGPSLRLLKAPARRAHSAVVGVLHPPGCPKNKRRRPKHSPRRLDWFNLGTVRCTVQNPRRHLYAFIRGAPPDAPDRQQKYFFSDSLNLLTLLPPVVISFTLRLRTRRRGPLRTRAAALPS